jgi:Chromo (CHRromatin Organisation MOdifier) domain
LVLDEIVERKIIKGNNESVVQLLIKWLNIVGEDSTWEDYNEIASKYTQLVRGMSADEHTQLVTVEQF